MQINERRRRRRQLINQSHVSADNTSDSTTGAYRACALPRDTLVAASLTPMCVLPGVPLARIEQLGMPDIRCGSRTAPTHAGQRRVDNGNALRFLQGRRDRRGCLRRSSGWGAGYGRRRRWASPLSFQRLALLVVSDKGFLSNYIGRYVLYFCCQTMLFTVCLYDLNIY